MQFPSQLRVLLTECAWKPLQEICFVFLCTHPPLRSCVSSPSVLFAGLTASLKQFVQKATLVCTEVSAADSGTAQLLRWKHWCVSRRQSSVLWHIKQ